MRPLVQRIEVTREILRSNPPAASGDTAVVYVTRCRRFIAERALTGSEIWFGRPHTAYVVDIGTRSMTMQLKLPSQLAAFSFEAEVSIGWRVGSPLDAIDSRLEDGEAVIRPILANRLRELSQLHAIEDSTGAERTINDAFGDRTLELPHGILIERCLAFVGLDKEAQTHLANQKRAEWAGKQRDLRHISIVKDANLSCVESEAEHELNALRNQHRLDLEAQSKRHELELKKLTMSVYAELLEEGQIGLLKARLEQHPEDIDSVLTFIMRENQTTFENSQALWEMAVNRGLVSPSQVSGLVDQLTTGIAAPFASEQKALLADGAQITGENDHTDTVDGEVIAESEKPESSDLKDDDDDSPV